MKSRSRSVVAVLSLFRNGLIRMLVLMCLASGLTSCIKVDTGSNGPTMGAELIDLARANELGKISDEEFAALRRKVLASF